MRTLYISYFGLREPLVQTQVLPYLREVGRAGTGLNLLTFEPRMRAAWTPEAFDEARGRLAGEGVRWFALPYHKRPTLPATLYDVAAGACTAARIVRRYGIDTVHARGHIPAVMGAAVKKLTGARLLFDIRGFMAEEYVDAGVWPAGGALYRMVKSAERRLLRTSDGFAVLTERAREILFPGAADTDARGRPVEVIPCCVDSGRFALPEAVTRDDLRARLGVAGRRVVVYVGSLGGWYMNAEMAGFLAEAHRQDPTTFTMILSQSPPEQITGPLARLGLPAGDVMVRAVAPEEVPSYLWAADLAVSFVRPCYSKLSSSPTKFAEYLACGLPVVSTAGVGDVDAVIEADRVGVLLHEFNPPAYRHALEAADALRAEPGVAGRCASTARARFDLEGVAGVRYRRLYERLHEPRGLAVARASAG
jgi:glycosyltransferase involved in cell wall biosynthesis